MADKIDTTQSKSAKTPSELKLLPDNSNDSGISVSETLEYGLPLREVYRLAFSFYKEKEGKAVHFSYEDKLQLVAFSQQVLHGPLSEAIHKLPPLGTLDVVGKDRRLAWQKLGQLSADQARTGFVELLSRRCPLFSAYVEAHRRERKEQEWRAKEEEKRKLLEEEERIKAEYEQKLVQERHLKEEAIKRQIQQALNEQTYDQFRKYAEQQFPGDPEKQGALIKQLQEQHYIQYMQQLQAAQSGDQHAKAREKTDSEWPKDDLSEKRETVLRRQAHSNKQADDKEGEDLEGEEAEEEEEDLDISSPRTNNDGVTAASMWTRSDIQSFKQSVSQAEGDGVVKVGHGETVTVRVPTHSDGSRLFWEFATDHYDIGFGVYFEFGTPTSAHVSVHVSESDDEDLEELDEDLLYDDDEDGITSLGGPHGDLEAGQMAALRSSLAASTKPLLTEIVPVYRRDCQSEVYAGSHQYPGQGVYLLKFDNSYSLWRSKTLYYRVYYTH